MRQITFGGCRFTLSDSEDALHLHTFSLDNIGGDGKTHVFPLAGAFLVHIGSGFWRFVTGAAPDTPSRHLFDDAGKDVDSRVADLSALGVPILSKEDGKRNLEQYRLPVRRMVLAA